MDPYLLARGVHILSALLLFGTGLGTAFHMYMACRSGLGAQADVAGVARVARQVVLADWIFTAPAAVAQPLSGFWLVVLAGYDLTELWLLLTYLLYAVAGTAWLAVVKLQLDMRRQAGEALRSGAPLPAAFGRAFALWVRLGWLGFASLTVVIVLMVTRPALW
mgnify:CR=1 FL=1